MKPEMTDAQLDEAMAVEVMGWQMVQMTRTSKECWGECHTNPMIGLVGHEVIEIAKWHPTKDLNQAWECLVKWVGDFPHQKLWHICNGDGDTLDIDLVGHWITTPTNKPARAICEAVLMAVRGER